TNDTARQQFSPAPPVVKVTVTVPPTCGAAGETLAVTVIPLSSNFQEAGPVWTTTGGGGGGGGMVRSTRGRGSDGAVTGGRVSGGDVVSGRLGSGIVSPVVTTGRRVTVVAGRD